MSHVVSIKLKIKDLEAARIACEELGLTWKAGQKTYKWWGRSVGDYPLPAGFTQEDLGKCDHAIGGFKDSTWEVGVVKLKDGTGYTLLFDFFGSEGRPILEALGGKEAGRFTQLYGVNAATLAYTKAGHSVARFKTKEGQIRLEVSQGRFR